MIVDNTMANVLSNFILFYQNIIFRYNNMNSYIEILFWTITVYIIAVAIYHFIKVLREKQKNNTNLVKAIVYLSSGITLALLLIYKPFGITKIAQKFKRPIGAGVSDAVMITATTMGPTSVSV